MATASVSQSLATNIDLELLVARLTQAIQNGDIYNAKNYVAILSNFRTKLNIDLSRVQTDENKEKKIDVTVHVEDRLSQGTVLNLSLSPSDSILDLKRKMWLEYNFPVETQRWIIGKKFPDDATTLQKCGVSSPGCTIFLYLVTARDADLQQQEMDNSCDQFGSDSFGSPDMMTNTMTFNSVGMGASLLSEVTQVNTPSPAIDRMGEMSPPPPPVPARRPVQFEEYHDPYDMSALLQIVPPTPIAKVEEKQSASPGWYCSVCTYCNLPTRPGCEMCTADRPENYIVPDDYELTEQEASLMALQVETERQTRQNHETTLKENFERWLNLENIDLVPNTEDIICPICFEEVEEGDGIVLRECLHPFCKECLVMAVTYSEEAMLKCPYTDGEVACNSVLQEREIRALVPEEMFVKYLQRGLDQAESQSADSFHCKSADCKGWCIYEDEVNFFLCPICKKENCLTCKVIHEGMNCKEYQADLASKAINDEAAKKTQEFILDMVNKGTAMHCPKCKIILQKKDGCDWIKCSVCKTEICWVTKGPRWGPQGYGDTSGGCKCNANARCHPKCANCH